MGTTLATYYAKLQDMPDSEYKVEILEDGPIKKIAVNGVRTSVDRKSTRLNSSHKTESRMPSSA